MRIAIVGGGIAGLTTAWLLQDDHEIMLFERQARLGGHAQTVEVVHGGQAVAVDAAAEFFGNTSTYPLFHRLLGALGVATRSFAATAVVYSEDDGRKLVLPPWRGGTVDWSMLTPGGIADLVRFGRFAAAVRRSSEGELRRQTIGEFLERTSSRDFARELLIPFLLGQFGMPRSAFDDCVAYDILKYCSLAGPARVSAPVMLEAAGGTRSYIDKLAGALGPACISTGAAIAGIEADRSGLQLVFDDGQRYAADCVVIATGAADCARLYPSGENGRTVRAALEGIDTFEADVAIHGDASIMPGNRASWSVANFRRTDRGASLTVWKAWLSGQPLFKTWITAEDRVLRDEYARFRYRHPIGNRNYYAAQEHIRSIQGRNGVWLCGSYVHDNDCHESAVQSAVNIASSIAPLSRRLARLLQAKQLG